MLPGNWGDLEFASDTARSSDGYAVLPTHDPDTSQSLANGQELLGELAIGSGSLRNSVSSGLNGGVDAATTFLPPQAIQACSPELPGIAKAGSCSSDENGKDPERPPRRISQRSPLGDSPIVNFMTPQHIRDDGDANAMNALDMVGADGASEANGLGKIYRLEGMPNYDHEEWAATHASHKTIGTLAATAICGNDITASCFYVVGELSKNAGIYAPVCTVLSSLTLHCFRHIYGEVVSALPLNGGIYNLLLNSSTKRTASVAACLTILSYTATGVVSAVSAADYVSYCFELSRVCVVPIAIAILAFFAFLMLLGMKESSLVASILFLFHLMVLCFLSVLSLVYINTHGLGQLQANMRWEHQPPIHRAIFFGFSSAMLGVSGFETSANFVEEQKPDVFPKTLTNMWASVTVINIMLPLLSIAILPLDAVTGEDSTYAVAYLAEEVAGTFLRNIVAIDALLVLSGSVLTSYVGVTGLLLRMAGDRCLPEFFNHMNSWRRTPHYSILLFFGICASMCLCLQGDITMLSAIYSFAFLLVMGLYAFAGLMFKVVRPTLPRPITTHPALFVVGLTMVSFAFMAVYLLHPETLRFFFAYYLGVVFVVALAFARTSIYTTLLWVVSRSEIASKFMARVLRISEPQQWMMEEMARLWNQSVVYFVKNIDLSQLNRALQYIEENEEARCLRVVHVYGEDDPMPHHLIECVRMLDCVYPKIRLDCILVPGEFGPALMEHLSDSLAVPTNCMFINCPKEGFKYSLDQLRGVRVILNTEKSSMLEKINTPHNFVAQMRRRSNSNSNFRKNSKVV
jgi:amino acid transporter